MSKHVLHYIKMIDPSATLDDVVTITKLNDWDIFIEFKDGRKRIFDSSTGYHKDIFYDDINEITEEQERKEFIYRLRTFMARNNINQEELAEKIGTTQTMISRYIRGETIPNVFTVRKIAKVLNCSMDDLFYQKY